VKDQGHVAVYISKNKKTSKPLYGKIIHAYAIDDETGIVGITSMGCSHFLNSPDGYYEYAVLPNNWLFTK